MSATPATGFRIPLARPSLPPLDAYTEALEQVWDTGRLSNDGPFVRALEQACAELGDWEHAVATANADLALTLTIAALDLPPGTPVLLPSLTFGSTLHAALWNRLEPRFVDVDEASFCLDPGALEAALRRGPAGLVLATHAFGAAADLDALERVTAAAGAALVLDGAHALATEVDGVHVGRRGSATAFSLSATKLVTAAEGGMVATADDGLAERLRVLRAYGRDGVAEVTRLVGLNAKLSELHAALGTLTLDRLEDEVTARESLVRRYREGLAGIARLQAVRPGERPSRTFLAAVLGPHRDAVERRLLAAGIQTRRVLPPLHRMDPFARLPRDPLPATERLGHTLTCLPLYAGLSPGDVDEVVGEVRAAVEETA